MLKIVKNLAVCSFLGVVLSGCATVGKMAEEKAPVIAKIDNFLADASSASIAGNNEKAISLLKAAASAYPTDKKPWLQMAQLHFDNANYGEAIVNALEALQREPNDKVAGSIVAVSGLRLSTKALADLSRQNNLSGSLKTEAQDLAKLLRESLGETELVAVRGRAGTPYSKVGSVNRAAHINGKAVHAGSRSDGDSGNANPFGSLK